MTGYHEVSRVLTFLVFLTGVSLLHLSSSNTTSNLGDIRDPQRIPPTGLTVSGDRERGNEERVSLLKEETVAEEELFKDVDPQTLAAVLIEALNHSHFGGLREEDKHAQIDKKIMPKRGEDKKEEEYREVRTMDGADQGVNGQESSELLMATLGREQETEAEEGQRALVEEEKMTEKVTSHTTSQTVQVAADQQLPSPDLREESGKSPPQQTQPISSEQVTNEEEEQLSPEELKSLETMMKEFPRLSTATKRKEESEQNQRESRGHSSHNNVIPINKGSNLAMSKKKLKWQEETQKALNLPVFTEGNFMDDFEDSNYGGDAALLQVSAEQEAMEEHGSEDEAGKEEIEEEVLSPEEEEARAKAEQEEMRRQAAEAQRAKIEEEKLADIASDMLLHYMVKQNHGNKKYSSSLSSAAEDKRSDEDQGVMEDDDVDPRTIDKLIEISSKLHLPADDVVDIINDVEKKKKKDMPPELILHWQPMTALPSSFSSTNGFSAPQVLTKHNNFPVSKQTSLPITLPKSWFLEKMSHRNHRG
uniref:VGF nerve growth factor inducible n=1 Tax=Echeneis naucrates TaxID=173247 RepID=A0A665V9K1_ECHNA